MRKTLLYLSRHKDVISECIRGIRQYVFSDTVRRSCTMTTSETSSMISGKNAERTVEVQGIVTHLFEGGSSTAPPLLYLHGTHLGNLWLEYHHLLARNFHVFAPDIPGF